MVSARAMISPCVWRRLAPFAFLLAVLSTAATLRSARRLKPSAASNGDTIFVSVGSYRDVECAATLLDLYRQARRPEAVFVGVVTYSKPAGKNGTEPGGSAAERCEAPELAPFERNIRRLSLDIAAARGPSLSRHQGASLYDGEQYLLQIDSHMRFAPGWDEELLRMIRGASNRNSVLTHYPPSWDDLSERRVPSMCMARWVDEAEGQQVLMFEASLMEPPAAGELRPVPFAAGGFMFAPAHVMKEVPFDPSLDFLFHGEEALYSARLWTSGWELLTPDRNVAFHHYGRVGAPKFWDDFGDDPSYHSRKAAVLRKVEALMVSEYGTGFQYGMGKQRSVRQWWQYAGLHPANRLLAADGSRFCSPRRTTNMYGSSGSRTRGTAHGRLPS